MRCNINAKNVRDSDCSDRLQAIKFECGKLTWNLENMGGTFSVRRREAGLIYKLSPGSKSFLTLHWGCFKIMQGVIITDWTHLPTTIIHSATFYSFFCLSSSIFYVSVKFEVFLVLCFKVLGLMCLFLILLQFTDLNLWANVNYFW